MNTYPHHKVLSMFPIFFSNFGIIKNIVSESSVMKSTVINSSKEMSAYSDFPPKPEEANFMHNSHMHQYFVDYANKFMLNEVIKLHHKVGPPSYICYEFQRVL